MPYYKVYFRYVDGRGKLRKDNVRLDATDKADAKRRVIRGEKPKLIAVDKITKQ